MTRLFHVSDAGPLPVLHPRPSPSGTEHEGRLLVWAVDEDHLPHYLLPRQCPRVCWRTRGRRHPLLGSPAARVVAVERGWVPQLQRADLTVHELDATEFAVLDEGAGYWVSEHDAAVTGVRQVGDCLAELAGHDVEVRLSASLWPYQDAVVEAGAEFSAIRMRHARARSSA